MFGNYRLTREVEELEKENTRLANVIKNYDDALMKENRNAEFIFDFERMNAFAIERIFSSGGYKTIIGYQLDIVDEKGNKTKQIKEWSLFCSIEKHNELAAQLKEYLSK